MYRNVVEIKQPLNFIDVRIYTDIRYWSGTLIVVTWNTIIKIMCNIYAPCNKPICCIGRIGSLTQEECPRQHGFIAR